MLQFSLLLWNSANVLMFHSSALPFCYSGLVAIVPYMLLLLLSLFIRFNPQKPNCALPFISVYAAAPAAVVAVCWTWL